MNGDLCLLRRDARSLAALNKKYIRRPGTKSWIPKFRYNDYRMLTPYFEGQAYLVGKGASLDKLTASNFNDAPIICINEAVLTIEALGLPNLIIGIRQEGGGIDILPNDAYMLIPSAICGLYDGYKQTIICNLTTLGINGTVPSVCMALAAIKGWGPLEVTAYGFDALTEGSLGYCNRQNRRNKLSNHRQLLRQPSYIRPYTLGMTIKWMKSDLENYLLEI